MTYVEKRGIFFLEGVVVCRLERENWDGKEEGEIVEERVGRLVIYSLLLTDSLCQ